MRKLKRPILILASLLILTVITLGSFSIVKLFFETKRIKTEGIQSVAIINKIWRSKCGSGYGNSASFKLRIGNSDKEFISRCNVPNEVKVGDRYIVKYLKDNPSKNLIIFNKKIVSTK